VLALAAVAVVSAWRDEREARDDPMPAEPPSAAN